MEFNQPIYPIEPWTITETQFKKETNYRNETTFALSNGYLGTRGTLEEGYLFTEKEARRIYAYTEDYNLPSQKLCEKLGMRREGMFMEFVSFINDENGNPIYENTC